MGTLAGDAVRLGTDVVSFSPSARFFAGLFAALESLWQLSEDPSHPQSLQLLPGFG